MPLIEIWDDVYDDLINQRDAYEKLTSTIDGLREYHRIQGEHGNWNYDGYMCGIYNGLELALSLFEAREPVYRRKPDDGWMADRDVPYEEPVASVINEEDSQC